MKRFLVILTISALICATLCGCDFWMYGEHLSVTPHKVNKENKADEIIDITSHTQLQNALEGLIELGAGSGVFSASNLNSSTLRYTVDRVINNLLENNAMAAYSVEQITYEIGTNRGIPVIAVDIGYRRSRTDVMHIKQVESVEDATKLLQEAMRNCDLTATFYVENFKEYDFKQYVINYGNKNPDIVMEIPAVEVGVYPKDGTARIVEINFTYQSSPELLKSMKSTVTHVFTSAELYVRETNAVSEMYSQLYSFLMARKEYKIERSKTPAYSLLHDGIGDSQAFAVVYAIMCRKVNLECSVISGTRDGEPWYWNLIRYKGDYYHVDLLRCNEQGKFKMVDASDMDGYIWEQAE